MFVALLGGISGVLTMAVLGIVGLRPAGGLMVVLLAGSTLGGYVVPDRIAASKARHIRSDARAALSAYLDLVNILLAGGAGLETALQAAAESGDGWMFESLRSLLVHARTARQSVWGMFIDFGRRSGLDDLVELGSSVQLVGQQGARIAQSLASRAATMRARVQSAVELDAVAASERMGLPTVLMFFAFLVLLGFPAAQIILASS